MLPPMSSHNVSMKLVLQGSLRGLLGGAGAVLEAYKRRLGGSLDHLGAVLGALEAMLESKSILF